MALVYLTRRAYKTLSPRLYRALATVANLSNFVLPSPSSEQELVLKAVRQGRNARVNAVAGSGKTTTILQIANAFPNRRILGMYTMVGMY